MKVANSQQLVSIRIPCLGLW